MHPALDTESHDQSFRDESLSSDVGLVSSLETRNIRSPAGASGACCASRTAGGTKHSARIDHGATIEARTFAAFPDVQRAAYQGRLSCPERACGAAAHFRRRSKDGKPDLFFSRDHVRGCSHRSSSVEPPVLDGDPLDVAAVWNDATDLVLRLDDGVERRASHGIDDVAGAPVRGRRHSTAQGERRSSTSRTKLRPLLRRLLDEPNFRESGRAIDIGGGVRGALSPLCVEADGLDAQPGRRLVVWGPVRLAREVWLDCAPRDDLGFSVRIPRAAHSDVIKDFDLSELSELAAPGARFSFIVVGVLEENRRGALYVNVKDTNHVAVLRL